MGVLGAHGIVNGAVAELGAGVVDRRDVRVSGQQRAVLGLSGDNLLRELTYLHVGSLLIDDGAGGTDVSGPGDIMALAPAGWSLDTTEGYDTTIKAILHQYEWETVLEALVRLTEITGEHFRLGSGRTVIWMRRIGSAKLLHGGITGTFTPGETVTGATSGATGIVQEATASYLYVEGVSGSFVASEVVAGAAGSVTVTTAYNPNSGLRAVQAASSSRVASNPLVCLITDLEWIEDTYDTYIGRVYAVGTGNGDAKVTLQGEVASWTGWTVGNDSKGYYLQHTSTWTTYGIERPMAWKDIADSTTLMEQAYEWMLRRLSAQEFYRLSVIKLDGTLKLGQTIRVIYHEWREGYHAVDIDEQLIVLEKRTTIGRDGVRGVELTVATIDRWPEDDVSATSGGMTNSRDYYQHDQPMDVGNHHVTHENGGADEISVAGLSGVLADAQTATTHASSHQSGGGDPIKLDDLAAPEDNTDLNASAAKHGLLPKLDGSIGKALLGTGTWGYPTPGSHKSTHEAGGSDALSGNLSITDLALSGKITQASQVIGAFFTKTIVDNVATSVFRIATTNEAGSNDGGGYSVLVHALIDHSCDSATTDAAAKSFTAQFARVMIATGTGNSCAVSEDVETAVAANGLARTLGTVTMTVLETSEYNVDVQFTVDLTGSSPGTGKVHVWVQLIYAGFLTPPVLSQL